MARQIDLIENDVRSLVRPFLNYTPNYTSPYVDRVSNAVAALSVFLDTFDGNATAVALLAELTGVYNPIPYTEACSPSAFVKGRRIMTAPPTITVNTPANVAAQFPTFDDIAPSNPKILSTAAMVISDAGWVPDGFVPQSVWGDNVNTPAQRQPGGPQTHTILADCLKIAVKVFGYQGVPKIQFKVDGEYVEIASRDIPNTSDYTYYTLTFASRATRKISALISGDTAMFCGFRLEKIANTHKMKRQKRTVLFGDSYFFGQTLPVPSDTLAVRYAEQIGSANVWPSGVGGTGYIADNFGVFTKAINRIDSDILPFVQRGDEVIVALGINDYSTGVTPAQVGVAAAEFANALMSRLPPGVTVTNVSPWRPRSGANSQPDFDAAVNNAWAAHGVASVDVSTLYTGSGRIGATTGIGNSDVCIQNDQTHLSSVGADVAAVFLAANKIEV